MALYRWFPIKTSIYEGCSMAMSNNQMVIYIKMETFYPWIFVCRRVCEATSWLSFLTKNDRCLAIRHSMPFAISNPVGIWQFQMKSSMLLVSLSTGDKILPTKQLSPNDRRLGHVLLVCRLFGILAVILIEVRSPATEINATAPCWSPNASLLRLKPP